MFRTYARVVNTVAGAVLVCGVSAAASQTLSPAGVCGKNGNYLDVNGSGEIFNEHTSALLSLVCGISQDQSADIDDSVNVYYADGNSNGGANFSCYGWELSADWATSITSGQKVACPANSHQGGCTPGSPQIDPNYAASGYVTISGIQHGGGFTTILVCGIPAQVGVSQSRLKKIRLVEVP